MSAALPVTVYVTEPPLGLLAALSETRQDMVEQARLRLEGLGAMVFAMKTAAGICPDERSVLGAIELQVEDCVTLLSAALGGRATP